MKKLLCILMCLFLTIPLLGSADPLDLSDATVEDLLEWQEQIEKKLIELDYYPLINLKEGSKGDEVTRLQERLKELNYYTKDVTGRYNESTASAVKAFQRQHDLKATGSASIETQEVLFSEAAHVKTTPTPKPTRTPKPTPTPSPTPVPESQVLTIAKAKLYDEYNTKVFSVDVKNNSRTDTIDGFSVVVRCFDLYGELLSASPRNKEGIIECDWWKPCSIKPGKTFSMGSYYWYLFSEQNCAQVKVAVSKYHTKDGKAVILDEKDYQWVDGFLK